MTGTYNIFESGDEHRNPRTYLFKWLTSLWTWRNICQIL